MRRNDSLLRLILVAGIGLLVFVSQVEAVIIIRYPVAPGYDFSSFGLASGRFVREYRQLNGAAGGAVIPFTMACSPLAGSVGSRRLRKIAM
jgi:hypothetical protein